MVCILWAALGSRRSPWIIKMKPLTSKIYDKLSLLKQFSQKLVLSNWNLLRKIKLACLTNSSTPEVLAIHEIPLTKFSFPYGFFLIPTLLSHPPDQNKNEKLAGVRKVALEVVGCRFAVLLLDPFINHFPCIRSSNRLQLLTKFVDWDWVCTVL